MGGAGPDGTADTLPCLLFGKPQFVEGLEVHPGLGGHAKPLAQAQGRVDRWRAAVCRVHSPPARPLAAASSSSTNFRQRNERIVDK